MTDWNKLRKVMIITVLIWSIFLTLVYLMMLEWQNNEIKKVDFKEEYYLTKLNKL